MNSLCLTVTRGRVFDNICGQTEAQPGVVVHGGRRQQQDHQRHRRRVSGSSSSAGRLVFCRQRGHPAQAAPPSDCIHRRTGMWEWKHSRDVDTCSLPEGIRVSLLPWGLLVQQLHMGMAWWGEKKDAQLSFFGVLLKFTHHKWMNYSDLLIISDRFYQTRDKVKHFVDPWNHFQYILCWNQGLSYFFFKRFYIDSCFLGKIWHTSL